MPQRLLFALGFVLAGFVAGTGSATAAFDPTRDELMGVTAAVVGVLLGFLTMVYAVKWYFGADQQPVIEWPDAHASHDEADDHAPAAHAAPLHSATPSHAPAAETHAPAETHAGESAATPLPTGDRGVSLIDIEGIGPAHAATLKDAGLETTDDLLLSAGSAAGRRELAAKTGLSESQLLEWVNRADLMRVSGIGSEYSDLLEAAGVDTVRELAQRSPRNLHKKLTEVNAADQLVRRLPTAAEIEAWVAEAKTLPPAVSH